MSQTETDNGGKIKEQYDRDNVLVVDDEPRTARFLLELLAGKGIGAQLATTKAGTLIFRDPPGVVL